MLRLTALSVLLLATRFTNAAVPALFMLKDAYVGNAFYNAFDFFTDDDPTHGRVNYVSKDVAIENNLTYASSHKFVMRADHENIVTEGRGRDSIRIKSYAAYTDSVTILDLSHMPEGCSTWPAFWTLSARNQWPSGGEIDVIEGVNQNVQNLVSEHTTSGCTMANKRAMTGETTSTNCDASVNFNQGCGVKVSKPNSYGSPFNSVEGGWYVLKRSAVEGNSVWFWARNDPTVPPTIRTPQHIVIVDDSWGLPDAYFPTTSCSPDHFDAHNIIFDLTFCGDFAGSVYSTSGCPSTCVDFVDNNPSSFIDAYWEINSLRVFTPFNVF